MTIDYYLVKVILKEKHENKIKWKRTIIYIGMYLYYICKLYTKIQKYNINGSPEKVSKKLEVHTAKIRKIYTTWVNNINKGNRWGIILIEKGSIEENWKLFFFLFYFFFIISLFHIYIGM